jgi:hypothetical protein
MVRSRLDLDAVDALLDELDAHRGAPFDGLALGPQTSPDRGQPLAHEAPESGRSVSGRSVSARTGVRPRSRRRSRPSSLPPTIVPPGYRLDGRGTWRYCHNQRRVPGARHLTLSVLWPDLVPAAESAAVLVPDRLSRLCPELAWCRMFGVCEEARSDGRSVLAWRVDRCDWEDHDGHTLGLVAPELLAHRLVGVEQVARLLGVTPSTVTSRLARGQLVEPQVRLAGRPAWSAVVLTAHLAADQA